MPSSFTERNRLVKQATGENTNTWGITNNESAIEMIDAALDGMVTLSAGGETILSSANGADDQSRGRFLNCTAATAQSIVIPETEKLYLVRAVSQVTIGTGAVSAVVPAGQIAWVVCDGVDTRLVQNADFANARLKNVGTAVAATDATTKGALDALDAVLRQFVVDQAFATQAGSFPGLPDNRGRYLQVNDAEAGPQWDVGFEVKTADFNAIPGGRYVVDTTAGIVTATLWADGQDGDVAWFKDGGNTLVSNGWQTNKLVLARNGSTIMGLAENLDCDTRGGRICLTYNSSDFRL